MKASPQPVAFTSSAGRQGICTARKVEAIIRENGAVPATIAVLGGRLKAGLSPEEIDYLGKTGAGGTVHGILLRDGVGHQHAAAQAHVLLE